MKKKIFLCVLFILIFYLPFVAYAPIVATWMWSNATGEPDEYEVQVTLDAEKTWTTIKYVPHDLSGTSKADIIDVFGVYQVRVRGTNTEHTFFGPWSEKSDPFRTYGRPGAASSIAVIITNP